MNLQIKLTGMTTGVSRWSSVVLRAAFAVVACAVFAGFTLLPVQAGAGGIVGMEREVTFRGAGGLELKGTLLLPTPKPGKKAPALLLLAGSGPTGRDGGIAGVPGDGLLKQIADRLASGGIATLRYDKRAVGAVYAEQFPKDAAGLNRFFSWQNFVDDAANGLAFLRSQPEIDPARVGVLGHSEGGMIALQLGSGKTLSDRPAALVLVATPGRTLEPIIAEQLAFGLQNAVNNKLMTKAQVEKLKQENQRVMDTIIRTGVVPPDVPPELAPIFPAYAPDLLRNYLTINNAQVAAAYPGPVLIVQGERDTQVSPTKDAPALLKALRERKQSGGVTLFFVPLASHNLRIVNDVTIEPGISGPVAPDALTKISDWLASTFVP